MVDKALGTGGRKSDKDLKIRVKSAKGRKVSSTKWLERQLNDPYVAKARAEGYRSRAAYKIRELDERYKLFHKGQRIVDLGAAPGGWSQVAAKRVGRSGKVIAIDLLPVEPIAGVTLLEADFGSKNGRESVQAALGGRKADLVLSDMAPNLSGIAVSDQARCMELAEIARDFALLHLQPEGGFLVKIFQGAGYDEYLRSLRAAFRKVVVRKPDASRDESAEQYLLARGLKSAKAPEPTL